MSTSENPGFGIPRRCAGSLVYIAVLPGTSRDFPEISGNFLLPPTRQPNKTKPAPAPKRPRLRFPLHLNPTPWVVTPDGPPLYIALRHQAVVSMLRNFVLSPRER